MTFFLALQATYDKIEIALCNDQQLFDFVSIDKTEASKQIVTLIDSLLQKHSIVLEQLSFIAVNQGPAPFTTLRVVITTANGINFATNIPLIGINALETFITQQANPTWPYTMVLLNAFNKDVYYAVQAPNQEVRIGCDAITTVLTNLRQEIGNNPVQMLGNGALLFNDLIREQLPTAHIPDPLPLYVSLHNIKEKALQQWQAGQSTSNQLLPLYLKTVRYTTSITTA